MVDFKVLHESILRAFNPSSANSSAAPSKPSRKTSLPPPRYSIQSHPCVSQKTFLENVGIHARLMKLLTSSAATAPDDSTRDALAHSLITSFRRLVDEMGNEYQVYCLSSSDVSLEEYVT